MIERADLPFVDLTLTPFAVAPWKFSGCPRRDVCAHPNQECIAVLLCQLLFVAAGKVDPRPIISWDREFESAFLQRRVVQTSFRLTGPRDLGQRQGRRAEARDLWHLFTAGSPRASTHPILRRRRRCWTSSAERPNAAGWVGPAPSPDYA